MALTGKMVASEVLMCGVKFGLRQIPIVGEVAVNVVDSLQKRHESMSNTDRLADFEAQLSRVERGMRDMVENEIRIILGNLSNPGVPGPELTREMTELRQIYEQGWVPNLFEGLIRNSSHWNELKRNPKQYGRILSDNDPVDPENGMHLLIDREKTCIMEMPASSLAFLLGNQAMGIPEAEVRVSQDVWAYARSPNTDSISSATPSVSEQVPSTSRFPPVPDETTLFKCTAFDAISKKDCTMYITTDRVFCLYDKTASGFDDSLLFEANRMDPDFKDFFYLHADGFRRFEFVMAFNRHSRTVLISHEHLGKVRDAASCMWKGKN